MRDDILIGDTPKAKASQVTAERLARCGAASGSTARVPDMAGVVDPAGMFVFTLVRNPWDRMVSYYTWLQSQSFHHPAVKLAKAQDFSGFLNDPHTQISAAAQPLMPATSRLTPISFGSSIWSRILAPLWKHLGFQLGIPIDQPIGAPA